LITATAPPISSKVVGSSQNPANEVNGMLIMKIKLINKVKILILRNIKAPQLVVNNKFYAGRHFFILIHFVLIAIG
jgi:hypothetical protein